MFIIGRVLLLAYGTTTISTHPYISVGCSFNSDCNASYTGFSIKGVNMETCLYFTMNNLGYILLAVRWCDGHSAERLWAILTLIVTGIYRLSSQCGEENVPFA